MAVASHTLRRFGKGWPAAFGNGQLIRRVAAVPAFFLFRLAAAMLLLKLSASALPVAGFTELSQLMLFSALVNSLAAGGVQNALIRQSAAAVDTQALAKTCNAGFSIWGAASCLLAPAIAMGSGQISHVLIGTDAARFTVIGIGLASLAAGPGQIWCSTLTGRKRAAHSLLAQATGLACGTLGAAAMIWRGQPQHAALAFACGPLVTMGVAGLFTRGLELPLPRLQRWGPEIATLLRYSAAFTATAGYTAIVLFLLRWYYRSRFGAVALGYWLAANRISDMSTQLLGLAMVQLFLPQIAMAQSLPERRRLIVRYGLAGVATMGTGALVFSLGARPLVHMFLSDSYLGAIAQIRLYMAGDVLRVWTLLAMYSAFARGNPYRYAMIEMCAYTLMLILMPLLGFVAGSWAPFIAYVGGFAIMAIILTGLFLTAPRRDKTHHGVLAQVAEA